MNEVIKSLFPRDFGVDMRDGIEASLGRVVAEEYLDASTFDLDELTERVVSEEFRDLPEDGSDALYEGVIEGLKARLEEIIREQVRAYLSDVGSNVSA